MRNWCSWYQLCSTNLFSPKIPSSPSVLHLQTYIPTKSRSSYLSLAWARQHSSSQRKPLAWARCAEANISLKRAEYFKLKKGSRLSEIGSIWTRLGENGGKGGSPLHERSLKRAPASLEREWRQVSRLGEKTLTFGRACPSLSETPWFWATCSRFSSFSSLFLAFSFTLLEFSLISPEKHTK